MSKQKNKLGQWGEAQAATFLGSQGCELVERNWRCTAGEVDLVVQDGDVLAFVEVRTRRGERFGTPEASITPHKLAHMIAVAETYVYEQGWPGYWRLDVIAVQAGSAESTPASIEWYKNVSI
ncbi:MAG: YraN family protein [Anaerolineae bacterium]|nr:YraN family protein [Anaerolineae bacterium]